MEHLEYLDFDLEITHEAGRDYLIKTHSPAGEAEGRLRFPYDDVALENHLLKLQNALLRSGGPTRRSLSAEEQAVQIFGRALFDALMDGDVGRRYAVCRARADQEDKGLRLRLHIQSPDLAALPWEYLFDYGQSEFLGLSRYTLSCATSTCPTAGRRWPSPHRCVSWAWSPVPAARPSSRWMWR